MPYAHTCPYMAAAAGLPLGGSLDRKIHLTYCPCQPVHGVVAAALFLGHTLPCYLTCGSVAAVDTV